MKKWLFWGALVLMSLPAWATTITPMYGESADDATPMAPLPDNPGRTLGEQRRHVHEHVQRLAERMFWLPDDKPIEVAVSWTELPGFCGQASVITQRVMDDTRNNIEVGHSLLLLALDGQLSDPNPEGNSFKIFYSNKRTSLSLNPAHGGQVVTGLHEFIHMLGFGSSDPTGTEFSMGQRHSLFDLHIRLAAHDEEPWQMSETMLHMLAMTDADARWEGTVTSVAVDRLLTAGHSGGRVLLAAGDDLSHLSFDVRPYPIMAPGGATTLDLGIVAYMLSDLGWGPVVDSQVEASVDDGAPTMTPTLTAKVTVDAGATSLVVTATLPEGLRSSSQTATPATCEAANMAGELVCTYATHNGEASIQYQLSGTRGLYEVEVDVDHQDNHVDPRPVNNFDTVEVAIGANTIETVSLSPASVAEARPAGTEVGRLGVTSEVDGLTHTFALASGGRHNACFRIEDDKLLTAKPFDREGASSLNLRVLARASNGFEREQDFTVEVTAAGSAAATGWTWSTAAHAGAGMAALNVRTLALAALLLACAGASMTGIGKRRSLARRTRWAAALLAVLLVASCGGGGGGGGSSPAEPSPPPAPAFTC